jgi:hypothetical protein
MAGKTAKEKSDVVAKEDTPRMKITGDLPHLETNIDRLYEMVKKNKSMSFLEAAGEFNVDKEQIASWSKILEDHKLAKVHYPIFGSPIILSMDSTRNKKSRKASEEGGEKPGKKAPKIIIALIGGLMVFFGYVMFINNPFTITFRSSLASGIGRITEAFRFLPYPFSIIIPLAIVIAILVAIIFLRRRLNSRKEGTGIHKERKEKEDKKQKPKASRDEVEDKLEKIKKELGS